MQRGLHLHHWVMLTRFDLLHCCRPVGDKGPQTPELHGFPELGQTARPMGAAYLILTAAAGNMHHRASLQVAEGGAAGWQSLTKPTRPPWLPQAKPQARSTYRYYINCMAVFKWLPHLAGMEGRREHGSQVLDKQPCTLHAGAPNEARSPLASSRTCPGIMSEGRRRGGCYVRQTKRHPCGPVPVGSLKCTKNFKPRRQGARHPAVLRQAWCDAGMGCVGCGNQLFGLGSAVATRRGCGKRKLPSGANDAGR